MLRSIKGDLVLLFVALCWGITFPLMKKVLQNVDPFVFVAIRFLLAAAVLVPFALKQRFSSDKMAILRAASVLGILNAISYSAQTVGMETLSSAEGAFITGVSVVIVPLISPLFKLGIPRAKDFACSLLCLIGLFILTGATFSHISGGDLWTLLCAVVVAFTFVYLQKVSTELDNLLYLAFFQILFTGVFSLPLTIGRSYAHLLNSSAVLGIFFCAIFATSIALLLQTKFQRYTTATRAAMIYCFEPIFGSLFGYLLNGEVMSWKMLLGAFIIFFSIVISEIYPAINAWLFSMNSHQLELTGE